MTPPTRCRIGVVLVFVAFYLRFLKKD